VTFSENDVGSGDGDEWGEKYSGHKFCQVLTAEAEHIPIVHHCPPLHELRVYDRRVRRRRT
jgi:hypothetical protein